MITRRRFGIGLAALAGMMMVAFGTAPELRADERVVVFAAASLKNALDEVNAAWQAEEGKSATISYASSAALAKQIEQGAPADVFFSADLDWMSYLSDKGLTQPGTEAQLLGNRIVLIAPKTSSVETTIAPHFDLAGLLGDGRLAMADVNAVPAGKYGKAALEALGVWASVADRTAQAENVRAALALVSTGEAPLGIVYRTDAAADPDVRIIGEFQEDTHLPIIYLAALTAETGRADARVFLDFLRSDKAKAVFEAQGFAVLAPAASN